MTCSAACPLRRAPAAGLSFLREIWATLGGDAAALRRVELEGSGDLPAAFAVSDLAAATIASAGLAVSELVAVSNGSARVRSGRPAARVLLVRDLSAAARVEHAPGVGSACRRLCHCGRLDQAAH